MTSTITKKDGSIDRFKNNNLYESVSKNDLIRYTTEGKPEYIMSRIGNEIHHYIYIQGAVHMTTTVDTHKKSFLEIIKEEK
jgi:hypothetical protein